MNNLGPSFEECVIAPLVSAITLAVLIGFGIFGILTRFF